MMMGPELERLIERMADAGIVFVHDRFAQVSIRKRFGGEIPAGLIDDVKAHKAELIAYMRGEIKVAHCFGCVDEDHCDGVCADHGGFRPLTGV